MPRPGMTDSSGSPLGRAVSAISMRPPVLLSHKGELGNNMDDVIDPSNAALTGVYAENGIGFDQLKGTYETPMLWPEAE